MQAEVRTTLRPLFEGFSQSSGPAMNFIRSRVERMSERWIQAGLRMRQSSNKTASRQMKVWRDKQIDRQTDRLFR